MRKKSIRTFYDPQMATSVDSLSRSPIKPRLLMEKEFQYVIIMEFVQTKLTEKFIPHY